MMSEDRHMVGDRLPVCVPFFFSFSSAIARPWASFFCLRALFLLFFRKKTYALKKKGGVAPACFLHCIARLVARGHRDKNPAKNGKHRLLFFCCTKNLVFRNTMNFLFDKKERLPRQDDKLKGRKKSKTKKR
ncbi:hypothetical protein [Pandoravirus japonicus]|uniref:Uncharacterized protein n=1 Tax=Pandoravirus japonicus TaxID=2823154 RepID=A0A811BPU4_9VIRU|nr:hypothetical protein [Pandoravirus japonicus]